MHVILCTQIKTYANQPISNIFAHISGCCMHDRVITFVSFQEKRQSRGAIYIGCNLYKGVCINSNCVGLNRYHNYSYGYNVLHLH